MRIGVECGSELRDLTSDVALRLFTRYDRRYRRQQVDMDRAVGGELVAYDSVDQVIAVLGPQFSVRNGELGERFGQIRGAHPAIGVGNRIFEQLKAVDFTSPYAGLSPST